MEKRKSSREFFIQRWWKSFCLHSTPNTWVDNLDKLLTVRNFPCLNKLKIKDMAQDRIRITVEILKEDATICKCGPIYRGRYFKKGNQKNDNI